MSPEWITFIGILAPCVISAAAALYIDRRVRKVHKSLNGPLTKLLKETRRTAHARGVKEGEQTRRDKVRSGKRLRR